MTTNSLTLPMDDVQATVFSNALSFHYEGKAPSDGKLKAFCQMFKEHQLNASFMLTQDAFEKAGSNLDLMNDHFEMGLLVSQKQRRLVYGIESIVSFLRKHYFVPKVFRYKPTLFIKQFRAINSFYPILAQSGFTIDSSDSLYINRIFAKTGMPVVVPVFNETDVTVLPLSRFSVFGAKYTFFEAENLSHLLFGFLPAAVKHFNANGRLISAYLSLDWLLENLSEKELAEKLLPVLAESKFTCYSEVIRQAQELGACSIYRL